MTSFDRTIPAFLSQWFNVSMLPVNLLSGKAPRSLIPGANLAPAII